MVTSQQVSKKNNKLYYFYLYAIFDISIRKKSSKKDRVNILSVLKKGNRFLQTILSVTRLLVSRKFILNILLVMTLLREANYREKYFQKQLSQKTNN